MKMDPDKRRTESTVGTMHTIGAIITADCDQFVRYSKYDSKFTVTKGMCMDLEDCADLYANQIKFQELLSQQDLAPRIVAKDIKARYKNIKFMLIVSEDVGLPIEESDIPAANDLLDALYDQGIILHWCLHQSLFVKGFDGKIRVTDFKQTELYDEPIGKHNRKYVQWKV